MIKKEEITVTKESTGQRLDKFLSNQFPEYSRSYFKGLIKDKNVISKQYSELEPKTKVHNDDIFIISFEEKEHFQELIPENIDIPIIYEDKHIIVINKPPNLVVHPAVGNPSGTVVNALLGRNESFTKDLQIDKLRPGIVHRLDKDTSGCLVVAKHASSHFQLSKSFEKRGVTKEYTGIVCGHVIKEQEKIVTMIGRHPVNRKKMAVLDRKGKQAISEYKVIERGFIQKIPFTILTIGIKTGRTHQIRVHLAHKNYPILGDKLYGGKQSVNVPRQMLHATKLSFSHPHTGKLVEFEAPFFDDFEKVYNSIKS